MVETERRILIGLSGKLGSGRETAAYLLCNMIAGLECRAFTTRVHQVVSTLTNTYVEEENDFVPRVVDHPIGEVREKVEESLRTALGQDLWIRCVLDRPSERMLITDCRYKEEARAIQAAGGLLIRMEGDPDVKRDLTHLSETDLDDWPFVHVIQNDASCALMEERLKAVVMPLLKLHKKTSYCRELKGDRGLLRGSGKDVIFLLREEWECPPAEEDSEYDLIGPGHWAYSLPRLEPRLFEGAMFRLVCDERTPLPDGGDNHDEMERVD
jgi:dephospho-CoA kinase